MKTGPFGPVQPDVGKKVESNWINFRLEPEKEG